MPVLAVIAGQFTAEQPFAGLTIAACLPVTAETAVLVQALRGLPAGVHAVPPDIEDQIARLALASSGGRIDTLTPRPAGIPRDLAAGGALAGVTGAGRGSVR
jgi:S-adenosylhomocysteine hydrolase